MVWRCNVVVAGLNILDIKDPDRGWIPRGLGIDTVLALNLDLSPRFFGENTSTMAHKQKEPYKLKLPAVLAAQLGQTGKFVVQSCSTSTKCCCRFYE